MLGADQFGIKRHNNSMFGDIVLNDGTTNYTYAAIAFGPAEKPGSTRAVQGESNLSMEMKISHEVYGKDQTTQQGSMFRLNDTVEDALGNQGVVSVQVVVRFPTKVATAAQVEKTKAKALSFITGAGNWAKFLNREG